MAPCSPQRAVLAPSPALPFPTVPIPVLAQAPAEQGHHFSPQRWILSAAKCLFCQHVPNPQPKADENTMGGRMGMSCPLRQSPGGDSHSPNGGEQGSSTSVLVLGYPVPGRAGERLSTEQGWPPAAAWPCHKPEQDPKIHGGGAENILALQGLPGLSDQSWLLFPSKCSQRVQATHSSVPTPA